MKQKLFTLFLALVAGVGTMFAWDYERVQIGDLYYNLDATNQTAEVTSQKRYYPYWSTTITSANIPASVTYSGTTYSVTSIGEWAFSGCTGLTSVTIPNSVTSIGRYAFEGCSGLTSVTIPNSVTSIGNGAFYNCSGLTSVTIPNSVTSIGNSAFSGCSALTSVTIPNSVTSIGGIAFSRCSGLTSMTVDAGNTIYDSRDNCNAIIEIATNTLIAGCQNTTIPNSVTSIGNSAFSGCTGLTSVTIPNSVTSIGNYAFSDCSGLTSVTIPNSVTSIGSSAFSGCSGLTSIEIPNSVTSIGTSAFEGCTGLTSVTIPNSVTSIGEYAFYGCSGLTSVTIGNSVTSIGTSAFEGCTGLTSVTINSNAVVKKNYTLKNNINNIFGTQVTEYIIGDSVTSIGNYAFYKCSGLTSVTIPNSVTSIGDYAFNGCANLTAIYIPCEESLERFQQMLPSKAEIITVKHYALNIEAIHGNVSYSTCEVEVPLTAVPDYGYHFTQWSDSITENPRVIQLTQDTAFTAEFAPNQYNVSMTCDDTFGHIEGEIGELDYLTEHTYEVVANYGYHFTQWSDSVTDNPRTIVVTQDTDFTAVFAPNQYTIQDGSNANQGHITGVGSYDYLSEQTITAVNQYGYHFTQWSDSVTDNPRTVVLTQDTAFTAEFAKNTYSAAVQSSNDEWGTATGSASALYLDEIQISATSNYGYHFTQWSDGNTDAQRTIVLSRDTILTAEFAKNVYAIVTDIDDPAHGIVNSSTSALYLDAIEIAAISNYGYHFTKWSDGNTDNPRTIVLTRDTAFTAEFAVDKSGVCGHENQLTWLFEDATNTLFISGNGALDEHYTYGVEAPTQTTRLIIEEGVTAIGNSAFVGMCATVTSLSLPGTVTTIGDSAFFGLSSRQFNTLILPNDILSIGNYAFSGAAYITSIHFGAVLEDIGDGAFAGCRRVQKMTCLAEITPNVGDNALTSINSAATLYVPQDYLFEYQIDDNWNRFLLQPLGATGTTTDDSVTVEAHDNNAVFTWPVSDDAATYTIEITKDGEVFCTLIFNANGQLMGIAFAPSRSDEASLAPAAVLTANGWQFTVTGLNNGTNYGYTLAAKDAVNTVIASYSGEFTTTGAPIATSLDETGLESAPHKIYRNGRIYILRGDKTYTPTGQEVK